MYKRILAVALCALLALAFTACGGSGAPAKQDFAGITLESASFPYDGEPHNLSVEGTLPAGTNVTYENNAQTNAGSYTVTAILTNENYNTKELTATLTITKAQFTGIKFEGDSVLYDGEAHSIFVTGSLPEDTNVTYTNNGQTEKGDYTVTATLENPNYETLTLTAPLRIYTVGDVASTLLSSIFDRPAPWSFLPAAFAEKNIAYGALPPSDVTGFADFVSVGDMGDRYIGKQLNVLYDGLSTAETALTAANVIFTAGETIAAAYQNFIDKNPNDYDNFTGSVTIAGVPFSLKITLGEDTATLLAGNDTVSVELVSDSSENATYTNRGRIQLTNGVALKYEAGENALKFAVEFTVAGIGVLQQIEFVRSGNAVTGYLYEYYGAESVAIKTSALLYSDSSVTAVISNKRETDDMLIDAYLEVYDSSTARLIGGEVTETVKLADYDTYWFDLSKIGGLTSVRVTEDDDENDNNSFQPHTVYLNGSAAPFAYKTVGGLTLRNPSRRFDIEMKEVWYIVAEQNNDGNTSYTKQKALIPMLFVQTDQTDTFAEDVAEENGELALTLNTAAETTVRTLFAQLSESYAAIKENLTYDAIDDYIGENDPFFATEAD